MISFYVFPALLWVCLFVQAPAEETPFILKSVHRADLGERFRLTAEFVGSSVEAKWWEIGSDGKRYLKASESQNGKTTLETKEKHVGDGSKLFLALGDPKSQFFTVEWDLEGHGDRNEQLDMSLSTVTPGTDLVYLPNQPLHLSITVEKVRGSGHLGVSYPMTLLTGKYVTDDVLVNGGVFSPLSSFVQHSFTSLKDVAITNVTIKERVDHTINGYYRTSLVATPIQDDPPLKQVVETIVLRVHEKNRKGPFPDDFIQASFARSKTGEGFSCVKGQPCHLRCSAFANDIKTMEITKVNDGSEEDQQATVDHSAFQSVATLQMDPDSKPTPGTYVCRAETKNGYNSADTIDVFVKPWK